MNTQTAIQSQHAGGWFRSERRHLGRMIVLAAAFSFVLACGSSKAPTEPSAPADMAGRVTLVTNVGPYGGTIRVETIPTDATGSPKAVVTVNANSVVLLLNRTEGEFRSLAVGQWVRVWFNGPVAESYPVQGAAATVAIDSLGVTLQ